MTPCLVIDTNITLDLFVFHDSAQQPLHQALQQGAWRWLATEPMLTELARVLTYPLIERRLAAQGRSRQEVIQSMQQYAHWVAPAPAAPLACKDPDDQIFIDLACYCRCPLVSKDKLVLALRAPLKLLGVVVTPILDLGLTLPAGLATNAASAPAQTPPLACAPAHDPPQTGA